MPFSGKPQHTLADNDAFVALLRVAQENREISDQLVALLQQQGLQRHVRIDMLVRDMTRQSAPPDFVQAIAALRDDEVANKVLALLRKQ